MGDTTSTEHTREHESVCLIDNPCARAAVQREYALEEPMTERPDGLVTTGHGECGNHAGKDSRFGGSVVATVSPPNSGRGPVMIRNPGHADSDLEEGELPDPEMEPGELPAEAGMPSVFDTLDTTHSTDSAFSKFSSTSVFDSTVATKVARALLEDMDNGIELEETKDILRNCIKQLRRGKRFRVLRFDGARSSPYEASCISLASKLDSLTIRNEVHSSVHTIRFDEVEEICTESGVDGVEIGSGELYTTMVLVSGHRYVFLCNDLRERDELVMSLTLCSYVSYDQEDVDTDSSWIRDVLAERAKKLHALLRH